MTNAEAIETLRANYPDACFEQLRCAVDMAINALTKEAWKEEHPVSPLLQKLATNLQSSKQDADDTISRAAALDAVLNLNVENRVSWLDAVIDTIDALPPSPSRLKGKWLASDDMYETGICSCCRWDSREPFDYTIANFHFCPNCGADMREEND